MIGLWFTLRTHAALIWATESEEKKASALANEQATYESRNLDAAQASAMAIGGLAASRGSVRDSQLYRRILGQSLKHVGLSETAGEFNLSAHGKNAAPYLVPPQTTIGDHHASFKDFRDLSSEENEDLVRRVTEVAATAATVAARDAARSRKPSVQLGSLRQTTKAPADLAKSHLDEGDEVGLENTHTSGGHDAPNWSKARSSIILLVTTILYAIIAEILVNTVDVVLESVDVDEKFLGITLFALVPNTTEFLVCAMNSSSLTGCWIAYGRSQQNAISFAMNGNIALSMEIGSAYALQVCLLQIPALVLFSAIYSRLIDPSELLSHTFKYVSSYFRASFSVPSNIMQLNLPSMGHDLGHPLCLPPLLCSRRRQEQLLQGLDSRPYVSCRCHRVLSIGLQQYRDNGC